MKHKILQLQDDYLETKDKGILGQFYLEVLKYSKHIVRASKHGERCEDAYDLAEDITVRLMTNQEPVIKSTPAGYLNAALRFMGKPNREVLMFEWLAGRLSECDADEEEYQAYIDEVLAYIYCPERIYEAVEKCLRTKENIRCAREHIQHEDRRTFDSVMRKVKEYTEGKYAST